MRIQGSPNLINGAAVEQASSQEIATVAEWKDPEFEEGEENEKPIDPTTVTSSP